MKKAIKIPVHHYTEITDLVNVNDIKLELDRFFTNEGGKLYLVEVWA